MRNTDKPELQPIGKGGRPRKDLSELQPEWYTLVLTEMAEGASLDEIKTILNISNDLHTRWMEDEPEYSETIKRGIELSKAWWQKQGRTNLTNKDFSATLWYMNMKNRFGWRDRVDQDITSGGEKLSPLLVKFIGENDVDTTNR